MSLAAALVSGDVRALARAISLAEDRDPQATELVAEVQPHTGSAYLVGLTGAPGTGKSTLADALVKVIRDRQQTVGVIAVDPSSPFTGGAVLGDRIRMSRHTLDRGGFIRSMGSAAKEEGIGQVWDAVLSHQAFLKESGTLTARRQERVKQEVVALVAERAREEARLVL